MIKFHNHNSSLATIGLYRKKNDMRKGGVALLDRDNLITGFIEKPQIKNLKPEIVENGLINSGVYVMDKGIIDYIPQGFSDFGKDIFPKLIKEKLPIYGYFLGKPLISVDTAELYKRIAG